LSLDLVIDTAVFALTAGLFENGKLIWQAQNPTHLGHQEALGPLILGGFEETGFSIDQIDSIAVSSGPGSFSGLRMGMGFAKGFAQGLWQMGHEVRLVGINVLDAFLYDQELDLYEGDVLALLDAGRGRYYARSRCGGEFTSSWQGKISNLGQDQDELAVYEAIICGPFRDRDMETDFHAHIRHGPSPMGLWRAQNSSQALSEIKPIYLREADATVSQKPKLSF
jgi:tRNA threonylcarbamoyladenosine biosynthesis protein TsaB